MRQRKRKTGRERERDRLYKLAPLCFDAGSEFMRAEVKELQRERQRESESEKEKERKKERETFQQKHVLYVQEVVTHFMQ